MEEQEQDESAAVIEKREAELQEWQARQEAEAKAAAAAVQENDVQENDEE